MKFQDLLDRIAAQDIPVPSDGMVVPTREIIACNVRFVRAMSQLKQSALADMAGVSLSTIERVERAETVSDECLAKIAVAFRQEPGYYTAKRRPLPQQEVTEQLQEKYGNVQTVKVEPFRKQSQVRELASCYNFLIFRPGLGATFDGDIENLTGWVNYVSYVLDTAIDGSDSAKGQRRKLYSSVLSAVTALERRGVTVLAGTMAAPQPGIPDWKIGIISITPKEIDPGAPKRRTILVDRRWATIDQYDWFNL